MEHLRGHQMAAAFVEEGGAGAVDVDVICEPGSYSSMGLGVARGLSTARQPPRHSSDACRNKRKTDCLSNALTRSCRVGWLPATSKGLPGGHQGSAQRSSSELSKPGKK